MVHVPVALVRALGVRIEGVGVLHEKFLGAHEPEPRARLVAELPLDLVDRDGQLAIGADKRLRKVGENLLGGGAERELVFAAVAELEHVRAHRVPAASGAPELRRLQDGRDDLERAGTIHFFADDLHDLLERAHAERQVRVESAGDFAREAGAHQEAMRVDFGVTGILPERLYE